MYILHCHVSVFMKHFSSFFPTFFRSFTLSFPVAAGKIQQGTGHNPVSTRAHQEQYSRLKSLSRDPSTWQLRFFSLYGANRENYYSLKTPYLSIEIIKTLIISFSCFCVITLYHFVIDSYLKISFCANKFPLTVKQSRHSDPTLTSTVQAAKLQIDRSAHSRTSHKKSFKQWSVWELLNQWMYLKHADYL